MKLSDINPDYLKRHGIVVPKQKRHKYGAEKCEYNGKIYPSRLEANTRAQLDRLQAAGLVTDIQEQVKFDLSGTAYIADFVVEYATGTRRTIDAKGMETPVFKLKRKLFEQQHGPLTIVKRWQDVPAEGHPALESEP